MQSVLNSVHNKIIERDKTVGTRKYQKDWIIVDAKEHPVTNIGTEYAKCLSNDSDDRLATEIVTEVGEGRGKVPIFMPGSKFTALSCVPTHKQSIRCPPIDCKKRTGELP